MVGQHPSEDAAASRRRCVRRDDNERFVLGRRPMGNCLGCFESPPASAPAAAAAAAVLRASDDTSELDDKPSSGPNYETHMNGNKRAGYREVAPASPDLQTQRSFCQKRAPRAVESRSSDAKIGALFDQYKDASEDAILSEGIERLCNDLQLRPDEFRVLVFAWKLNAEQMCRFTRGEFVQGLRSMRVDSIRAVQSKLPEIVHALQRDAEQFKDLYKFTFKFGLDVASGQRILPADVAIVLWRLVFTIREPPILDRWLDYLEKHPHIKGVPKDTWYMFLNFCDTVGVDLGSYDDTEAWPSLFDDFVEYENDQMNQNISKSGTFKKFD